MRWPWISRSRHERELQHCRDKHFELIELPKAEDTVPVGEVERALGAALPRAFPPIDDYYSRYGLWPRERTLLERLTILGAEHQALAGRAAEQASDYRQLHAALMDEKRRNTRRS